MLFISEILCKFKKFFLTLQIILKENDKMKLDGRRESSNVEDRRGGMGRGAKAGMGIGGIVIVALLSWVMGGNPLQTIGELAQSGAINVGGEGGAVSTLDPQLEDSLNHFSRQVLGSTEDVWSELFREMGKTYEPPKMVLYTGSTQTSCGEGQSAMGPFYCSGDQCVYLDLSFLAEMKQQLGATGEFSNAYVVAHEVGHHIQDELGILSKAHAQMAQVSKEEANKISVRIELQADFFAGIWGYYENKTFHSINEQDIQDAIECAHQIGDNYLQKKAQGYVMPEAFTHGTSEQRMKWLKLGLTTGDMSKGDTFSCREDEL